MYKISIPGPNLSTKSLPSSIPLLWTKLYLYTSESLNEENSRGLTNSSIYLSLKDELLNFYETKVPHTFEHD